MNIAAAFANIAAGFSNAGLGPYFDSSASWPGEPETDDGGSIVTPGNPVTIDCLCQVDVVTDAMRADVGFRQQDVRLLILANGLAQPIDTNATITVQAGPSQGAYSVQSTQLDPMGVYFDCRGRRA